MQLVIECKGQKQVHTLPEGATVIGRDPSCDISFADPSLSRHHLACELHGQELIVKDLSTRNGTWLGSQRIKEARIPAGVSLRAGNVWFRFEVDTAEVPGDTVPWKPDLSKVPDAENFAADEEATPLAEEPPQEPSEADGARLIVRGSRWFVQDPQSGAEVEIVPRGGQGHLDASDTEPGTGPLQTAPLIVQPSTSLTLARREEILPARPIMARPMGRLTEPGAVLGSPFRRRIAIAAAAVFVLLLVALGIVLFREKPEKPPLSASGYRSRAEQAIADYQKGRAGEALSALAALKLEPVVGNPKLAQILTEAIEADQAAAESFEVNWEAAENIWQEVAGSSESTDTIRDIANDKITWLYTEKRNMASLNDAQSAIENENHLRALTLLKSIPKDSLFSEEAAPLIKEAAAIAERAADASAEDRDWAAAITALESVAEADPSRAQAAEEKIATYRALERQAEALEEATDLIGQESYDEALTKLEAIPEDSIYAAEAAPLRARAQQAQAVAQAINSYQAGDGDKAVQTLAAAGLDGSQLANKIRTVMKMKEKALTEIKESRFDDAKATLQGMMQLEPAQTNRYAADAKRMLDNMGTTIRATAALLVEEAGRAEGVRDYALARKNYEEALRLDPANPSAGQGIKKLKKEAVTEFNIALNMPRKTIDELENARQVLLDVRARLIAGDEILSKVENELFRVERAIRSLNEEE